MPIFEQYSHLFIRLSLLFAMLLVQESRGQSWTAFQYNHIDYPAPDPPNLNTYCNLLMVQRNLNPMYCKPRNTFINGSVNDIMQVCQGEGVPWNKFFNSTSNYKMIDCRLTRGIPPDDCLYKGMTLVGSISLACLDGFPVHLVALNSTGPRKPTENCVLFCLIFYSFIIGWQFRHF